MLEEGKGPSVQRSRGPNVPGSKGPRYLKLTFKYEVDSKEGPSCSRLWLHERDMFRVKLKERDIQQWLLSVSVYFILLSLLILRSFSKKFSRCYNLLEVREAFFLKKCGFFPHLPDPSPKVWRISRYFTIKKGQKRTKINSFSMFSKEVSCMNS